MTTGNSTVEMLRTLRLKIYEDLQQGNIKADTALRELKRYAEIARSLPDAILEAQMYDMAGIVCLHFGRLHQGLEFFTRTRQIFEAHQETRRLAGTLNNLAEIYLQQGQYAEARNTYQMAYSLLEHAGETDLLAVVGTNLGQAQLGLGNYEVAESLFNHALALVLTDDWANMAVLRVLVHVNARLGLAEVALHQQAYATAWEQVQEGIRLAKERQFSLPLGQLYLTCAHVAALDPTSTHPDTHYYGLAREAVKEEKLPVLLARLLTDEVYYQLRHQQIARGEPFAREALAILEAENLGYEAATLRTLLS